MRHLLKFILTTSIIFTFTINALTQCGTELLQEQVDYMNIYRDVRESATQSIFSISNEPVVLPLLVHIIRDSEGNGGLKEAELDLGIEELNIAFEPTNIVFDLCQINYIDNTNYFTGLTKSRDAQSQEYQMAKPNLVSGSVNVFFLPNIVNRDDTPLCGWSSFPAYKESFDKDWTVMNNDCVYGNNTLAHELGHYFNLYHTHQGRDPYLKVHGNELVDGSNCGPNVGDELCDTAAEPTINQIGNDGIHGCVNENCVYTCNDTDSLGVKYTANTENIMSYTYWTCAKFFSQEQALRIQESLAFDRSYLNKVCPEDCIYGCTDETALNYDPYATCNNDSCEYPVLGCTMPAACNYNPLANTDDGSCNFGNTNCPDPCEFCFIPGCRNPEACNYNPYANADDGTCDFGNQNCENPCDINTCIINGCMDSDACNYNPMANSNDGSCDYGNSNCEIPCNVNTCIDCSKNTGKIVLLSCGLNFQFFIETDKGEFFIPVFNQILPFKIKQGKKVNFDYKPMNKDKGSISDCKYGNKKVLITCIEEVIENKPDGSSYDSADSGYSPFGTNTLNPISSPFLVYPNPSKGEIFVSIENESLQNNTISVYNIKGKQINMQSTIELIGGIIELDLTQQPKGIYLVEWRRGDNTSSQKVIIE